jgi:hypothetical protein
VTIDWGPGVGTQYALDLREAGADGGAEGAEAAWRTVVEPATHLGAMASVHVLSHDGVVSSGGVAAGWTVAGSAADGGLAVRGPHLATELRLRGLSTGSRKEYMVKSLRIFGCVLVQTPPSPPSPPALPPTPAPAPLAPPPAPCPEGCSPRPCCAGAGRSSLVVYSGPAPIRACPYLFGLLPCAAATAPPSTAATIAAPRPDSEDEPDGEGDEARECSSTWYECSLEDDALAGAAPLPGGGAADASASALPGSPSSATRDDGGGGDGVWWSDQP